MFKNQWPAPGSSNWQMTVFTTAALGFLAVTLATALGPDAVVLLLKGSLLTLFVLGGGLMGLIIANHIGQTHIPVTQEDHLDMQRRPEQPATQTESAERGFLALFDEKRTRSAA